MTNTKSSGEQLQDGVWNTNEEHVFMKAKQEMRTLDEVLMKVETCGTFQVLLACLIHFMKIVVCWSTGGNAFFAYVPRWRCVDYFDVNNMSSGIELSTMLPDTNNTTSPFSTIGNASEVVVFWNQQCHTLSGQKCRNFQFEENIHTLVSEFDLVCDNSWVTASILSMQMIGMMAGSLVVGNLSDLFGRKKPFISAMGILFIFQLVCYFAVNWIMFAVGIVAVGIGSAFFMSINCVFHGEYTTSKWRSTTISFPSKAIEMSLFALFAWLLHDWEYITLMISLGSFAFMFSWLFPTDRHSLNEIKRKFYECCRIPNIIGAVDGTLIPIKAPSQNEEAYVCRKGYHALIVQAVCDRDIRFTDVVAMWPGSQHDSAIFQSCGLKKYLEDQSPGMLLGDSWYSLRRYLLTPKLNANTAQEDEYNRQHSRCRMVIEKAFGVLKSRFQFIPESIRWLIAKNKIPEVLEIIQQISKWNKRPLPDQNQIIKAFTVHQDEHTNKYSLLVLFRKRSLLKLTVPFMTLWFSLGVIGYGIDFGVKDLSGNIFLNLFLFSIISIPSKVISIFLQNRIGRKYASMLAYTVCLVGGIIVGAVQYIDVATFNISVSTILKAYNSMHKQNSSHLLIFEDTPLKGGLTNGFALAASAGVSGAWGPMQTLAVEVYPTIARNTAIGFLSTVSRLGAVLGPQFVYLDDYVTGLLYFVVAGLAAVCIPCILCLPETMDTSLVDKIIEDLDQQRVIENSAAESGTNNINQRL